MEVKTDKRIWVKILSTLGIIGVLVPMVYVLATTAISAFAAETSTVETKTYQEGCSIRVESTESVSWNLPRQPIDLVILQDASGSFEDNMPKIQTALKTLTSSTTEENYDENNPKLVFTNDPTTTDRVMLANYGGLDYIKNYDNVSRTTTATGFNAPASNYSYYSYTDSYGYIQYAYYYDFILVDGVSVQKAGVIETDYYGNKYFIPAGAFNIFTGYYVSSNAPLVQLNGTRAIGNYTNYKSTVTGTDSNFTNFNSYTSSTGYRYDASGLLTSNAEIDSKIDSIVTGGGTPTVPAVEDAIASYEAVKNTGGGMANNRKTVFLLITDGVANGYRNAGDSTVYMDRSLYRAYNLANDWATNGYLPEASQNYLARAKELEAAGDKLKAAVGADGKVVIGFFEDLKWLETFKSQGAPAPLSGYGYAYQNGFGNPGSNTTITTGDSRSVQEVFHDSLQTMASPDDVLPNGKAGTYFVNEQGDVDLFAKKILESIASAIVKEDVKGTFDITPGYEVGSVQINGKTIVPEDKLTDPTTQIRGTITQDGNKVTISVPESVFNPGDNKFTYNLVKTEAPTDTAIDPNVPIEEQEKPPADDYKAGTVTEEVGRLVGTFSVGEYTSPKIGDTAPTDVTYTDMAYCYPRVEKDVKDQDISNDKNGDDGKSGVIAQDELLPSRSSYAASLTSESEQFTYTMNYKMFNSPLEFKDNVKLLDKIDPRFDVKSVEVYEGTQKLDWNVTQTTLATGQTEVAVTVPKSPTPETVVDGTIVKATEYGGHVFKEYTVKIVAQLKDQYRYSVNASEYKKLMQDNGGLGAVNQATMSWDQVGLDTPQVRRSNSVYVQPPLETDIKKTVSISKDGSDRASEKTLNTRLQPYYYQITSTWPGVVGQYILEDTLVPELKVNNSTVGMDFAPTKDQVWITVDGIEIPSLQKFIKVVMDGTSQKVVLDIDSTKVGRTDLRNITREITAANTSNGPAVIELNINALIREDADLSKYAVDGKIKVPNDAKVTLDGNSKTSEKVYVTPDTPAVSKLIDGVDTLRNVNSYDQTFTYELIATLPSDIRNFNEYYIRDAVDPRLEITDVKISSIPRTSDSGILGAPFDPLGGSTTYLPQDYFTINQNDTSKRKADGSEANKQIITATLNADKFAVVNGGDMIRLIVTAKIKDGAKGAIENVATIHYTKDGEPPVDTPETPPVVVTPPPTITKSVNPVVEKRTGGSFDLLPENSGPFSPIIVKDGEKLEVGIWNDPFRFTVEAEVPFGSSTFKIEDPLEFAFQPYGQVASDMISGYDATRKVEIVDQSGNVVDTGYDLSKLIKVTSRIATAAESGIQQAGVDKNMYTMVVDFADAESTLGITHSQSLDLMHKIAGNKVRLTFDSQFKRYASLTDYVNLNTDGKPWVPNVANLVINDKSIPSNEVQVTPPINEPDISKTVDGVKNKDLSGPYQIFTYKIDTSIPYNATQFEVVDKLEPVLELITSPENFEVLIGDKVYSATDKVVVDGKERSIVTFDATSGNISVMLKTAQIEGNEGKTLSIRFSSRVKKNADLSKYRDFTDAKNQAHIPNEVTYLINNQPSEKKDTAEVAPPPPVPSTIVKKIEDPSTGKLVDDLVIENEKAYNYFVDITMPSNIYEYQAWQLEDVLDPRIELQPGKTPYLQFVGGGEPLDGQSADASDLQYYHVTTENVTVDGKDTTKILVKVNPEDMNKLHDKYHIRLVIPAQIKKDVLDKKIPNEATKHGVQPDGKDHIITTPPVYVTPPTPAPEPVKDVDGKPSLDLSTRDQEFEYHVKATVPDDVSAITEFTLYDDLEDILTVTGTSVTVAGQSDDKVSLTTEDGGKVTAALPKDSLANYAGKEVILTIKARIKAGVTNDELSKYVSTPEGSIPNKAKLTVGDNSGQSKETNNVPVTPPGETPTVEKKINGTLDDLDIANEKDYTYNIKSTLPVDITKYKSYVIVDTLDKDLAIQGTPSITGDAAKFFDVKVDGQTVTATMKDFANAKDFAGKSVELVITSQIKAGVTRQNIPNTAKVTYQDRSHVAGEPDKEVETPPVTVTPPTPDTPDLTKKVNKLEHADLANRQEPFTYTIDTTLPKNAFAFEVTDTLENVLSFDGDIKATVDGKNIPIEQVVTDGQKLSVKFTKEQLKAYAGQAVHIEFNAKVKDGADLSPYRNDKGNISVPNIANYQINNDPKLVKESNPVTITPPTPTEPNIDKKINRTETHLEIDRGKSYMYTINSDLPNDISSYKEYIISDTLDDALAINGPVEVHVDGYKLADSTFKVVTDGNHVTVTVKDFATLAGYKQIQLYIPSAIKEDFELDKAIYPDNKIPNTATVDFINSDGKEGSKETKPVTVTPPTPETPEVPEEPTPETPVKSVGHDDTDQSNKLILKTADETFRFDVQAVVPTDKDEKNRIDLTHFNMSDTLDPNLMVARVAVEITSTTSTIPEANFNYIDEDLEKATQELKDAQAKLDEISKAATSTDTQKSVEDAQAKVTDLENKLAEAEAKLAELKTTEPVPTDGTRPDSTVDNTAAITAQEAIITDLKGQLATAKSDLTVAQKVLSEAKTPAEIKVELDNQQKLVDKAQEAFDKADAKAKEVAEKANLLAKLINQGELTASEMAELGISTAKSQGQLVNVEITDKDTLEALKGYTVKTIIYSSIKPGTDLKPYLKDGFENIATVSFNHGPNSTWTKDTKPVHVFPPKPTTPDKPVTPPPGETPPRRTPPTRPSRPILPRNGDNTNSLLIGFGALLAGLGFVGLKKKEN
ncbi:isopeptide-forming domain-containing fimbrial protein [Streptococcus uberis]|uniref:isopeptide-forming domain-containing fimbrial protein n=2 Tax=Streptococcus uberis TaxID=1349 RepID=UPI0021503FE7|nr:isopeptide-forming domain-containing fimbrial protein [Streptococcus uberis]MCR4257843.1 isopeptide-forming domain-containing fimbrial protein [Streptococcus uberis]